MMDVEGSADSVRKAVGAAPIARDLRSLLP